MELLQQLVREVDRMTRERIPVKEVMAYCDREIAKWNIETLKRLRIERMAKDEIS